MSSETSLDGSWLPKRKPRRVKEELDYVPPDSIPEYMLAVMDDVHLFASECTDYLSIRKEIISLMAPKYRTLFKRRHYCTRLPVITEFDHMVIDMWKTRYGTSLVIDSTRVHPKDWAWKPRYHGLHQYNITRHKNRRQNEE